MNPIKIMKSSTIYLVTFLLLFISVKAQETSSKDSIKTTELKEVVVGVKKKAIEQKADRTIFDFTDQPHLNSGSLLEGLKNYQA